MSAAALLFPALTRSILLVCSLLNRVHLLLFSAPGAGAWPTFASEASGQSEAIASNLTKMAGLTVPIITLVVGEVSE